jgi:hypothetical protein
MILLFINSGLEIVVFSPVTFTQSPTLNGADMSSATTAQASVPTKINATKVHPFGGLSLTRLSRACLDNKKLSLRFSS